jgi:CubicO group peptidase (beta-lactamase class C family)
MRALLLMPLLLCYCTESLAVTTQQRIAAIEANVVPTVVIKGETVPVVRLETRMEQLKVPALSVAVFNNGVIEWMKAYGYADKERGIRATPATLFEAGSISKSIAAVGALLLVQRGKLALDANVNEQLRSWHLPDNQFTAIHKVTLRNILDHTAGTTVSGFPGYARMGKIPTPIEVLEGKGNTPAIRVWKVPGRSWHYSGGGYLIMQVLMSDVTGRPFADLMHDTVLRPLDMRNSTYEQPLPEAWRARAASGYDSDGVEVPGNWHVYPATVAAGLWTTAADLAKYALAVERINLGKGGILSRQLIHTMLTPGMNHDGLGVFLTPDGRRFGHDGGDDGFQSSLTAFINSEAGIAILTNSHNGGQLAHELMLTIARQYGWSGFQQVEETAIQLSRSETERLVGHYKVVAGGAGEFDVMPEDGRLLLRSSQMRDQELMAESPNRLFFRDDATHIDVGMQNGATTLNIEGMCAVKVH